MSERSKYRLKYRASWIALPIGDFVIGSSRTCNLVITDPGLAPRHLRFRTSDRQVVVEDLESTTGTFVNGEKLKAPRLVKHNDRVRAAQQELTVIEDLGPSAAAGSSTARIRHSLPVRPTASEGSPVSRSSAERLPPDAPVPERASEPSAFDVLAGLAFKALAMGDTKDAERILEPRLSTFLERAKTEPPREAAMKEATRMALRLASATGRTFWIDYVFRLHTTTMRLVPADIIEQLYDLVRKISYHDARIIREYGLALRARGEPLTPAEKFLLSRAEGLLRVVGP